MRQHLNTLYVTKAGTWLKLDGETVAVTENGKNLLRVPLHNLEAIQTFGWDIGATPQLMAHCAEKGIHLAFCNPNGKLFCRVSGFSTHGNVLLRRQQYRLADDAEKSLATAREMVAAKILNARTVVLRAARDRADSVPMVKHYARELAQSVRDARAATSAEKLLGIEGAAAEMYFSLFPHLITTKEFSFDSRNRRPPTDPVNALMSFHYALLASDCKSALEAVGLDSAVGVYHKDRPGRPGLALDMMEEFRATLADRATLTLLNRRQLSPSDFSQDEGGAIRLTDQARRIVLQAWQERKKEQILHPFLQEKITIGMLPHVQARLLAQHIRGTLDAYPPMLWK